MSLAHIQIQKIKVCFNGQAIETDFDLLNLDVRETQIAAIRLFEGLGYSRFGEHPYYARVGQNYVKGCFYFKKLNKENTEDI